MSAFVPATAESAPPRGADLRPISEPEFRRFQRFIFDAAGITLTPAKRALVGGRLAKRLRHHGLSSYQAYFDLLQGDASGAETQIAIDLLTTNETSFFREPKHFDLLRKLAAQACSATQAFRVWSAASSSGEEAYSTAMVLADTREHRPWEVFGSDICTRVLERASRGLYAMERAGQIPPDYLKRFCLRGRGPLDGSLAIDPVLRQHVSFAQINLNTPLPQRGLGLFDVVFLRNVMIYFSDETKRGVVQRVLTTLRPGGHLFIGHSESLNGLDIQGVEAIAPATYRKR